MKRSFNETVRSKWSVGSIIYLRIEDFKSISCKTNEQKCTRNTGRNLVRPGDRESSAGVGSTVLH